MPAVPFDLESVLRRDRLVVVTALATVIVLSWVYLLAGAGMGMGTVEMTRLTHSVGLGGPAPAGMPMPGMNDPTGASVWTGQYAAIVFFMWWIMMLGMMLPSATPILLLFARMMRKEREKGAPYVSTGVFALGYVVMWAAFSVVATAAQWGLQLTGLVSKMMVGTSTVFGAALLIAAGFWQLTPLKQACLKHCRSPVGFLSSHWRSGRAGALTMGLAHGVYCLGCCWFLMALLFYGGVMSLYWIIGLALYVLLEKLLPAKARISALTGVALIAWGTLLLVYA
ncbi:MAG: DUF2182 domain-containing protein [Pseudomonadota bacterium]|nr:DUF2182 domain-containing protein [Pseudomonadota bacterium]